MDTNLIITIIISTVVAVAISVITYSVIKSNAVIRETKEGGFITGSVITETTGTDEEGLIILKTQDCEMKIDFSEINKANIDLNWAIENKSYN